jgi:cyclopropane-fatty-acyl-phospholipid synthase
MSLIGLRGFEPPVPAAVFPGAYPPSLMEMMQIFEPNHLSILDVENLRLDCSLTLQHWMERYEAHDADILAMVDEAFVRTWRLYLAGSIAAFNVGELQLFQVGFSRDRNNRVPWSRKHLYADRPAKSSEKRECVLAEV